MKTSTQQKIKNSCAITLHIAICGFVYYGCTHVNFSDEKAIGLEVRRADALYRASKRREAADIYERYIGAAKYSGHAIKRWAETLSDSQSHERIINVLERHLNEHNPFDS